MEKKMTNREWAQLGHDLAALYDAWYAYEYCTNSWGAPLSERFAKLEYVLRVDVDTLCRRAESYDGLDAEWVRDTMPTVDWNKICESR